MAEGGGCGFGGGVQGRDEGISTGVGTGSIPERSFGQVTEVDFTRGDERLSYRRLEHALLNLSSNRYIEDGSAQDVRQCAEGGNAKGSAQEVGRMVANVTSGEVYMFFFGVVLPVIVVAITILSVL